MNLQMNLVSLSGSLKGLAKITKITFTVVVLKAKGLLVRISLTSFFGGEHCSDW